MTVIGLRQEESELPREGVPCRAVEALYAGAVVQVVPARRGLGRLGASLLTPVHVAGT